MTTSLPRRHVLSGGAGLAATAVLVIPTMKKSHPEGQDPADSTVVVRWNSKSHKWPTRPTSAEFGVVFLSTNDPAATAPTDLGVLAGDVWRLHPDADIA